MRFLSIQWSAFQWNVLIYNENSLVSYALKTAIVDNCSNCQWTENILQLLNHVFK